MLKTETKEIVYSDNRTIKILLVDDHPLLRQALKDVLNKQPDFDVIGEAGDGQEAIVLATKLKPHVVIMDISMPNINGLEATRQIKAKCPDMAILVLTVHSDNEHILSIIQAGASGYLTKSVYGNEVIDAVRSLAIGETVMSSQISQSLLKYAIKYIRQPESANNENRLTSRETEILKYIAQGQSNKTIALNLDLSERTVKGYIADLFIKLNVESRTQAVIFCLRKGIISLDDTDQE